MNQATDLQTSDPNSPSLSLPPGWHLPQPEKLPRPTYWPAVLALGVILLLWGTVTTLAISAVGLVLFTLAMAGWIGGLRHGD